MYRRFISYSLTHRSYCEGYRNKIYNTNKKYNTLIKLQTAGNRRTKNFLLKKSTRVNYVVLFYLLIYIKINNNSTFHILRTVYCRIVISSVLVEQIFYESVLVIIVS